MSPLYFFKVSCLLKVERAFESISADDWRKCAEHVKKLEEEHRQQDRLLDDMEPFIINVQSDDDSDEMEDNEAVEYSDEEFETEEYDTGALEDEGEGDEYEGVEFLDVSFSD